MTAISISAGLDELDEVAIDYEASFAEYQEGLVSRLRGFGSETEVLATWVPDEDLTRSLRNLLDALASRGVKGARVELSDRLAREVDPRALVALASDFGSVELATRVHGGLELVVRGLRMASAEVHDRASAGGERRRRVGSRADPSAAASHGDERDSQGGERESAVSVHPCHEAALRRASSDPKHRVVGPFEVESRSSEATGTWRVATIAGATLRVLVEPGADARIGRAAFELAPTATFAELGVMETLCEVIEGLPLREALDHGVVRTEFALRVTPEARVVPGVVVPSCAGAFFRTPATLLRELARSQAAKEGAWEGWNEYDEGPSQAWLVQNEAERRAVALATVRPVLVDVGLAASQVTVVAVDDVRVTLRLGDEVPRVAKPALLRRMERRLRDGVSRRLEVFVEERRDKNALRRLAVVQEEVP